MTLDIGLWTNLFDFNSCARVGKLLPNCLGFFFRHAFLHRLWRRLDEILGFFQTKCRNFAHNFDHIDLVAANGLQDYVEFGLLFRRSRSFAAATAAGAATALPPPKRRKSLPVPSRAVKPPEASCSSKTQLHLHVLLP